MVKVTVKVHPDSANLFGLNKPAKTEGTTDLKECHRPKDVVEWAKKNLFDTNIVSDFLISDYKVTKQGSTVALDLEKPLLLATPDGLGIKGDDTLFITRNFNILNVGMSSSSSSLCCACLIFMLIMMNQGDGF